ncbi:MAG: helix-turn-helix domain-containing protein [Candidatus Marinimicrobia bacterium]|nr:helix-turn-helix domain-containing protein [Candidatus Neomarinimicrobiota bacterium]
MENETLLFQRIEQIDQKLDNLKTGFPAWLSVRQLAEYLSLSASSIRKMISAGTIPFKRLPTADGGSIRFNRRQIDLWLLSGDVKPTARARSTFEVFL